MEEKISRKKEMFIGPILKSGQSQEEFFKSLISSFEYPFFVAKASDFSLVLANEAALEAFEHEGGYETVRNRPGTGLALGCTLDTVKRTKKPVGLPHVYSQGGVMKKLKFFGYPLFDEKGRLVRIAEYCLEAAENGKNQADTDKNEAMFRLLFDNMQDGVAIYEAVDGGKDFAIVGFNRAAEKIDKIKRKDLIGRRVTEVFPGVIKMGFLDVLAKVSRSGKPEKPGLAFYDDGRVSGWRNNYVYKLKSGQVVSIYNDVTAEKLKEEKIKENNIFLNSIISSLSHPFYVINVRDYSLIMANEAALQGRSLKGLTCYNISHKTNRPCDSKEHGCTLEIVKKTRKPVVLEHIHYDREGSPKYVDVHGYPVFDDKGELVQMIEYCIDISERKKMEMELEAKNALNESILDNAPFGIYVVNEKGGIDYVNEAMLRISGTPKDHFLHLDMFRHEFYRAIGLSARIGEALDGKKFRMEKVRYTSSYAGKTTIRNFSGIPMDNKGKKSVMIFVEDITGISQAQEEIEKRNAELEKFNEIAVDRELKMVELKKRIKELEGSK